MVFGFIYILDGKVESNMRELTENITLLLSSSNASSIPASPWPTNIKRMSLGELRDILNGSTIAQPKDSEQQDYMSWINQCESCEGLLTRLSIEYGKTFHVYVALIVCCFGTIANLLNMAVLTRKDMACAPINRILTGLAFADMLLMVEYIPFVFYYYVELPGKMNFPYWGAIYMLLHMYFTLILHTISVCLTLTLAIWRYLAIGFPHKISNLCSENRCTLGISLSYLLPVLLCIPTYFTFKIQSTTITEDKEYILYHVGLSERAKRRDYILIHFWIYAVVIRLLPCFILTIISSWLIRTLLVAKKRKQVLRGYITHTISGETKKSKAERRADRTTKMLIAVLLLFLITEFPQGMFGLWIGLKGNCIFVKCYQYFGEVMDILALLNGSINFILYCWMNRMFRMTFGQIFRRNIKWFPASAHIQSHTTSSATNSTKPEAIVYIKLKILSV